MSRPPFLPLALAVLLCAAPALAQYPSPLEDTDYADAEANIFLQGEVTTVTITMDPQDLQDLLADPLTDVYRDCTVRIVNSAIDETHLNVGIRPRGNSQRTSRKSPWKLSFNEFVPGRKVHGLKKINLSGDAPDPSIARSRMMFDIMRDMGVPASRTHYVWLEVNDGLDVSGMFIHHEQVDEIFLGAWFGNDDGHLYKCRYKGDGANLLFIPPGDPGSYSVLPDYEEQNAGGDFVLLAEFIDFLNNTGDQAFADGIGGWLNIDGFLRAQAADMIGGQWDGLWIGANNYYLYENTDTGRFEYIPWDLDHSFGQDYLFFPILGNFGTNFATKPYAGWGNRGFGMPSNDPPPLLERLLDITAYDEALKRYAHACAQGPAHPAVTHPRLDQWKALGAPLAFTGSFSGPTMDNGYDNIDFLDAFDSPTSYSLFSNPSTWGVKPFIERRRDYVESDFPTPQELPRVTINELVSDNETGAVDEAGETEDWVELFNDEVVDVDLSSWSLSDRPGAAGAWEFPAGTVIPAKGRLLVWCDGDLLQGPLHADFKLSNGGESVHLWMPASYGAVQVDGMVFPALGDDQAYGREPDGTPLIGILATPTPGTPNTSGSFAITASGNNPGPQELHLSGATPGGDLFVLAAGAAGSFQVPAGFPCAGTTLGLSGTTIRLLASTTADVEGAADLSITLPASLSGVVRVQALDANSCSVTGVIVP
jgi:hypothetical protein